jgi:D-amino-acid oxidase
MTSRLVDALVVGSGVSGLTTAVSLREAGFEVRIWTAEPPARTTSAAAGAIWDPYLPESGDRVLEWSRRTLRELQLLAADPATGVRMVTGIEASRQPVEPPTWAHLVPGFRRCVGDELPDGFADGFHYTAPLVDMPVYLDYLVKRFQSMGGVIERRRISSLAEATAEAPLVVNCTGIGARSVVPDEELRPIRGQLVVVANPGIDEFFWEETGSSPALTYIFPHGPTVVLGGTAEDGSWELEPSLDTAHAILARCAGVDTRLRGATILAHRVGLRPTRSTVRCEEELRPESGVRLVHNYGHGGAGVTLSWGCASEIVSKAALPPPE